MKTITIDASAAASWIFPRQATAAADAFISDDAPRQLIAPSVFCWEMGNQIVRRARRFGESPSVLLEDLSVLGVQIAAPPVSEEVLDGVATALGQGLSLLDSAYLQLSLSRNAALASRDARLLDAARAAGVDVFDLRD
jgi:predicted nucleic acid-binding protein